MTIQLVEEDLRQRFVSVCQSADADKPLLLTTTQTGAEVPVLNLDRLWHKAAHLKNTSELILEAVRRYANVEQNRIDTLVVLTSAIGSFGPLPYTGIVAKELNLDLVVANECTMGELTVYPQDIAQTKLRKRNILLFKDGILRGSSISRAVRLIDALDGNTQCILILVDIDNPTDTARQIMQNVPTIEFLLGKQLGLARKGNQ